MDDLQDRSGHAPASRRRYSDAELFAFAAVAHFVGWQTTKKRVFRPGEGPAWYACGDYWPKKLRAQADRFERLIPQLRLAAAALEREMERWP